MRSALAFLTPFGGARTPKAETLAWFPLVGGAIGGVLGLLWWAGAKAWPVAVIAVLVVAGDLAATGLLHLDGLADAADGLLPPLERERRLAVMRDPGVGAFGVGVCAVVLLARWAAVASIPPAPLLLIGVWVLSRAAMAVLAVVLPYARPEGGLASAFVEGPDAGWAAWTAAGIGLAVGAACLLTWRTGPGLCVLGVEVAATVGVAALAWRRIGGFTGDVLGAAGLVAETVALVVAAARW